MDDKNIKLFEGYTMQDLYKEVVTNSRQLRLQMKTSIKKLTTLMKTVVDAQIMGAEIANLLNIMVKNDEMLIKLASIVAKLNGVNFKMMNITQNTQLSDRQKKMALDQAKNDMNSILVELRSQYKDTGYGKAVS